MACLIQVDGQPDNIEVQQLCMYVCMYECMYLAFYKVHFRRPSKVIVSCVTVLKTAAVKQLDNHLSKFA